VRVKLPRALWSGKRSPTSSPQFVLQLDEKLPILRARVAARGCRGGCRSRRAAARACRDVRRLPDDRPGDMDPTALSPAAAGNRHDRAARIDAERGRAPPPGLAVGHGGANRVARSSSPPRTQSSGRSRDCRTAMVRRRQWTSTWPVTDELAVELDKSVAGHGGWGTKRARRARTGTRRGSGVQASAQRVELTDGPGQRPRRAGSLSRALRSRREVRRSVTPSEVAEAHAEARDPILPLGPARKPDLRRR